MSISILPIAGSARLSVTGDLDAVLSVPFDDDDRFLVGLSDGTLLQGVYDEDLRCTWSVARYGAAIIRICGERVELDWKLEWVTVSLYCAPMLECAEPGPLPLFPELDQKAA